MAGSTISPDLIAQLVSGVICDFEPSPSCHSPIEQENKNEISTSATDPTDSTPSTVPEVENRKQKRVTQRARVIRPKEVSSVQTSTVLLLPESDLHTLDTVIKEADSLFHKMVEISKTIAPQDKTQWIDYRVGESNNSDDLLQQNCNLWKSLSDLAVLLLGQIPLWATELHRFMIVDHQSTKSLKEYDQKLKESIDRCCSCFAPSSPEPITVTPGNSRRNNTSARSAAAEKRKLRAAELQKRKQASVGSLSADNLHSLVNTDFSDFQCSFSELTFIPPAGDVQQPSDQEIVQYSFDSINTCQISPRPILARSEDTLVFASRRQRLEEKKQRDEEQKKKNLEEFERREKEKQDQLAQLETLKQKEKVDRLFRQKEKEKVKIQEKLQELNKKQAEGDLSVKELLELRKLKWTQHQAENKNGSVSEGNINRLSPLNKQFVSYRDVVALREAEKKKEKLLKAKKKKHSKTISRKKVK